MVAVSDMENETIERAANEFVQKISALNSDPYFREAIMKFGMREIVWATHKEFEGGYGLAGHLRVMADLVEDAEREALDSEDNDG